jgi:hypothetical protein
MAPEPSKGEDGQAAAQERPKIYPDDENDYDGRNLATVIRENPGLVRPDFYYDEEPGFTEPQITTLRQDAVDPGSVIAPEQGVFVLNQHWSFRRLAAYLGFLTIAELKCFLQTDG